MADRNRKAVTMKEGRLSNLNEPRNDVRHARIPKSRTARNEWMQDSPTREMQSHDSQNE